MYILTLRTTLLSQILRWKACSEYIAVCGPSLKNIFPDCLYFIHYMNPKYSAEILYFSIVDGFVFKCDICVTLACNVFDRCLFGKRHFIVCLHNTHVRHVSTSDIGTTPTYIQLLHICIHLFGAVPLKCVCFFR